MATTNAMDGAVASSSEGGTGNQFTKFSGPTTSEKTFTLPNASASILTNNAAVTPAQGGTGLTTLTANNVILGNGTSNVQFVAPGTSGNLLTSNGTTWTSATPAAGSSTLVLLGSATASNSAALIFTSLMSSSYDQYMFVVESINPASTSNLQMAVSSDNGSTYDTSTSASWSSSEWNAGNSPNSNLGGSTENNFNLNGTAVSINNTHYLCGIIQMTNPAARADRNFHMNSSMSNNAPGNIMIGWYSFGANITINAVKFLMSTGNITSGTIRMYGVKNT